MRQEISDQFALAIGVALCLSWQLAANFEVDETEPREEAIMCVPEDPGCGYDDYPFEVRHERDCFDRQDDDHCYRELYRGMLEALDANRWYHEIAAISPTGVSFAKPTVVRPSRGETTY